MRLNMNMNMNFFKVYFKFKWDSLVGYFLYFVNFVYYYID